MELHYQSTVGVKIKFPFGFRRVHRTNKKSYKTNKHL